MATDTQQVITAYGCISLNFWMHLSALRPNPALRHGWYTVTNLLQYMEDIYTYTCIAHIQGILAKRKNTSPTHADKHPPIHTLYALALETWEWWVSICMPWTYGTRDQRRYMYIHGRVWKCGETYIQLQKSHGSLELIYICIQVKYIIIPHLQFFLCTCELDVALFCSLLL